MVHYLIEFRFFGKAKFEILGMIKDIKSRFHLWSAHRDVPHTTLVGPFSTNNERRLIEDFKQICESTEIMRFSTSGYGTFNDTNVVFINITPDKTLAEFRWNLSQTLNKYCNLSSYDKSKNFNFHSTLAMKIPPSKFNDIRRYVISQPTYGINYIVMRVTLIKDQLILCEYDFMLGKLLSRSEAKDRLVLGRTYDELNRYLSRTDLGRPSLETTQEDAKIPIVDLDNLGLIDKIKDHFQKRKVFFISDTHFDHTNIIGYCGRPFKTTYQMNDTILENWNKTIGKQDIVFFLGDIVYGRGCRSPDYWLDKLNGKIYFVNGNHEVKSSILRYHKHLILRYKGRKFLLTHDPADIPANWKDWVIHGHHHNNKPKEYPFINGKRKTINVSVEMINYTPLNFDKLLDLDYENIELLETVGGTATLKNKKRQ